MSDTIRARSIVALATEIERRLAKEGFSVAEARLNIDITVGSLGAGFLLPVFVEILPNKKLSIGQGEVHRAFRLADD